MRANYGYADGSGEWYLTIDTDVCDACGACVKACPQGALAVGPNDYDEDDKEVATVVAAHRKKVKYTCGLCKPHGQVAAEPCHVACPHGAIAHSW